MANVNALTGRLAKAALLRFGESIAIDEMLVRAILSDDEIVDDEMVRTRLTTITLSTEDAQRFKKGDPVIIRGFNFRIRHIPDNIDFLREVTLDRA